MILRPLAMALAAIALLLHQGARAQQAYPTQQLLSTGTTVVGETLRYPTSGPAHVTVSIVSIAPGADTVLHRHPAPLVAYILEGEVTVDYGDKGRKVFRKGEAMLEAMEIPHRGMNLGKDVVRILAVYIGAEGTPNVALEK
jgi:quercetin dioxygenase-like cupin family protein